jgi:PII-like signaling protein
MKSRSVTVVRIYVREREHLHDKLIRFLREERKVAGLTVLRGIVGFGDDGQLHSSSLVDLSLDLPLVLEFFEEPERVEKVVDELIERFHLPHVVCWPAVNFGRD